MNNRTGDDIVAVQGPAIAGALGEIRKILSEYELRIDSERGKPHVFGSLYPDRSGSGYKHYRFKSESSSTREYISQKRYKELAPKVSQGAVIRRLEAECLSRIKLTISAGI